ncbi:MAG: hypothetical protein M3P18_13775, partial [Actinomycetota bacterium]|nr:hypothetical protein [Actinomycetota bacterium]
PRIRAHRISHVMPPAKEKASTTLCPMLATIHAYLPSDRRDELFDLLVCAVIAYLTKLSAP